ncbi:MAG: hypothetical protein RQ982_06350 [Gammaproteobacteria bacterium]|nr:hypothetical protein [Gammaproteobacteria bacterium]
MSEYQFQVRIGKVSGQGITGLRRHTVGAGYAGSRAVKPGQGQ